MRTLQILKIAVLASGTFLLAHTAFAQQTGSAPEPLPAGPPANVNPAADSSALIPQPPDTVPKPLAQPAPLPQSAPKPMKLSKTEASIEQVRMGIRLYQAKTVALRDPAIQEQIAWAEAAKTDEGKRERLAKYYDMLYARIIKIDATLKPLAAARRKEAIASVVQTNIQKSLPVEQN